MLQIDIEMLQIHNAYVAHTTCLGCKDRMSLLHIRNVYAANIQKYFAAGAAPAVFSPK